MGDVEKSAGGLNPSGVTLMVLDPDGKDIIITEKTLDNGKVQLSITISGVISFDHLSTTVSEKGKTAYVNKLNAKLEEIYSSYMSDDFEVVFQSNFRLGKDSDIDETDHVLFVTNLTVGENKLSQDNIGGFVNKIGGKVAYFPKSLELETAAHEIGHLLGLPHPKDIAKFVQYGAEYLTDDFLTPDQQKAYSMFEGWTKSKAYNLFLSTNLMYHHGIDDGTATNKDNTTIDLIQFKIMQYMLNEGYLNQGDNSWNFEEDSKFKSSINNSSIFKAAEGTVIYQNSIENNDSDPKAE